MSNHDGTESTEKREEPVSMAAEEKVASSIEQDLEETRKKAAENWDLFLKSSA